MTPEVLAAWIRVLARAVITLALLITGIWLLTQQQSPLGYSFITFVAGYWLR